MKWLGQSKSMVLNGSRYSTSEQQPVSQSQTRSQQQLHPQRSSLRPGTGSRRCSRREYWDWEYILSYLGHIHKCTLYQNILQWENILQQKTEFLIGHVQVILSHFQSVGLSLFPRE
jgi:hypothetical protein